MKMQSDAMKIFFKGNYYYIFVFLLLSQIIQNKSSRRKYVFNLFSVALHVFSKLPSFSTFFMNKHFQETF